MRRLALFAALCIVPSTYAQTPAPQQQQQQGSFALPILLDKGLDSKKLKEGDPVVGKITFDISSNGQVVLPKDTRILGHITRSSAKGRGDSDSTLAFVFDKAALKDGKTYDLAATVQALAPPQRLASSGPPPEDDRYGAPSGGSSGDNTGAGTPAPGAITAPPSAGPHPESAPASPSGPTLQSNSVGVLGIKGMSMNTSGVDPVIGSVITADAKSVKLDGGTQLLIKLTKFAPGPSEASKK